MNQGQISAGGTIIGGMIGQRGSQGEQGNGIVSITKTGTSGLVDTYTILYDNGDTDTFQVTNGEKGDPGAIKFEIVNSLPTQDIHEDTIYLVPITPDIQGNNYEEYIYVNGQWELLGKIGVHVDLSDYVKNTDYATNTKGGVVMINTTYGLTMSSGILIGNAKSLANYNAAPDSLVMAKGTLEAVLNSRIGDINSAIDLINGEII